MKKQKVYKVRVSTRKWQAEYDRMPRGYGNWGFDIDGEWFFFTAPYADAKKKAMIVAKEKGVGEITLLT